MLRWNLIECRCSHIKKKKNVVKFLCLLFLLIEHRGLTGCQWMNLFSILFFYSHFHILLYISNKYDTCICIGWITHNGQNINKCPFCFGVRCVGKIPHWMWHAISNRNVSQPNSMYRVANLWQINTTGFSKNNNYT